MNQRGYGLLDLMIGVVMAGPLLIGAYASSRTVFMASQSYLLENSYLSDLQAAKTHIMQLGRLAESCSKIDEDGNGIFELKCVIQRNGSETVRFILYPTTGVLSFERQVAGAWVREISYSGFTSFVVCDDTDIKNQAADSNSTVCGKMDRGLSMIYAKSHTGFTRQFFRFSLEARNPSTRTDRYMVQSGFFVRNSVNYPQGSRYVWGWSDNAATN